MVTMGRETSENQSVSRPESLQVCSLCGHLEGGVLLLDLHLVEGCEDQTTSLAQPIYYTMLKMLQPVRDGFYHPFNWQNWMIYFWV